FLLVARTYINAREERRLFDGLSSGLVARGFRCNQLFCRSGVLAVCISPEADNLTTALLLCTVGMKVAENDNRCIAISCVNILIAPT
ncbi:sodium:proton antiporter NhaD, partial [Pseudoalteromonas sp. S1649]|uniref:sodium:proton antiporter NhaD n=1 Tax=Pseudoalteromonas sp. S1649 TaxID=579508 RepID=UPI00127B5968